MRMRHIFQHLRVAPMQFVRKFFAALRTTCAARKKAQLPVERKQRQFSIVYLILALFAILTIHSYYGSTHVEVIRYSPFKSLLGMGLISEVAIGETTIQGKMKGEAVKEIFTPEQLRQTPPEILESLLPFRTARVEDAGLIEVDNRCFSQGARASRERTDLLCGIGNESSGKGSCGHEHCNRNHGRPGQQRI